MDNKKYCKYCGEEIDIDARVCPRCGLTLDVTSSKSSEKEKKSKNKNKKWIFIGIIALIFIVGIFSGNDDSNLDDNNDNNDKKVSVTVIDFSSMNESEINNWCDTNKVNCKFDEEYSKTIEEGKFISQSAKVDEVIYEGDTIYIVYSLGKEPTVIEAGSYKVGRDLDAGKYIIEGSGYLEVCSSSNCDIMSGELLYNDNYRNRAIVILKKNQYFNFTSGEMYPASEYKYNLISSFDGSGYYEIGKDLKAGEYKLEGSGYYAICSKPSCDILSGELKKNDNITNGAYVTVKSGEYLIISGSISGSKI